MHQRIARLRAIGFGIALAAALIAFGQPLAAPHQPHFVGASTESR